MSRERYTPPADIREHARRCALAGKPVYVNPHVGDNAAEWAAAYRAVPEAERGTRPDLLATARRVRKKRPGRGRPIGRMAGAGVKALGDRCLPGSTPKPWAVDGGGW